MDGARNYESAREPRHGSSSSAPPSVEGGPRVVGRYLLWGAIGSGGCATVHLGRLISEAGFSRTVAIKRLHSECASNPEFVDQFLDEARLVARIHHRNVVPSLDVFWSAPDQHQARELLMIMEYVAGTTLSRLIARSAALHESPPQRVVLAIICDVLRGLHAAHEARSEDGTPLELVHRDVSPQNAIVGADGVARLLDFGIAKAVGRLHTTRQGVFKGKAAYMAPEQILGSANKLSDVYAAAVMLWEALTAHRLFSAENEAGVLHKVLNAVVPPPSSLAPGISAEIDAIVMAGLARDIARRPPNAQAMADALEAATDLASPSEVGAWVRRLACDELELRAAHVARMEKLDAKVSAPEASASGTLVREGPGFDALTVVDNAPAAHPSSLENEPNIRSFTHVDTSVAPPPAPSRKRRLAWALALFAAVALLVAVASRARPKPPEQSAAVTASRPGSAAPIAPPSTSASSVADRPPSEPLAPSAAAPDNHALPALAAPLSGVRRAPHTPQPPLGRAPSASSSNCSPPYVVDAAGRTHFKTECL